MKSVLLVVLFALVGFACWIGGSLYPAPPALIAIVHPQALLERTRSDLAGINWDSLQSLLGREQAEALGREAVRLAARAGSVVTIEHEADADSVESGQLASIPPPIPAPAVPVAPAAPAPQPALQPPRPAASPPPALSPTASVSARA